MWKVGLQGPPAKSEENLPVNDGYLLLKKNVTMLHILLINSQLNLPTYWCSYMQSQCLKDSRKIGTPTFFCRLEGTLRIDN